MMEGTRYSGRWNKTTLLDTVLLMSMFMSTLTLLQPSEEPCPRGDYLTEREICCNKCPPGFKLLNECQAQGQRSTCAPCPNGQYMDEMNYFSNCLRCKRCKKLKNEIEVLKCEPSKNTICRCEDGYYKVKIDSVTTDCNKCSKCGPDEKEKQACTPEKNTVCECKENYYRLNSKCVLCTNCTPQCKHHCPEPSNGNTAPTPNNAFLMNIIGGTSAVAIVLLVLVFLITHIITKRTIKKKLLKQCSPSSDVPPYSHEVLIQNEEEPVKSVKAVPLSLVGEQELSNLPDCVPLEIKTSELIYTVLDLVPVLQVKQLVRSLGVTDTFIERAEMDHRPCREAHYQMLKMWTERGSRAGRGVQGGMMHRPLLLELLDELRKMHLGHAAEELETKYNIQ
ncbi:hypothetical protein PAMA_015304 [Pampus argenteus]